MSFSQKKHVLQSSTKSHLSLLDDTKNYCTLPSLTPSGHSSPISIKNNKKTSVVNQSSSEKLIKTLKFPKKLKLGTEKNSSNLMPVIICNRRPKYLKPIDLSSIDSEDDSFLSINFEDPFIKILSNQKQNLQDPFRVHQSSKKPLLKPITPTIKFSSLKLKY